MTSYCVVEDVTRRLKLSFADIVKWENDVIAAIEEASCYIDAELQCLTDVPLVLSDCCIAQVTADIATGIFKQRTFKDKAGFESFDTRYWWDMGLKKLEVCKKKYFCGVFENSEYSSD